jgi:hypothetical protein
MAAISPPEEKTVTAALIPLPETVPAFPMIFSGRRTVENLAEKCP